MAISKSVLMKNGVTATYWKIVHISVDVQGLVSSFVISPFLDSTNAENRSRAVGPSKTYEFVVTEDEILSGTIDDVYTNILAKANSTVPNISGGGTHTFDTDLAGGSIV